MAVQWFGDRFLALATCLHIPVRRTTPGAESVGPAERVLKGEPPTGGHVLYYALLFLIVAIIAGLLGFGAVAFTAAGIAKILFFVFLILFLVSLVRHMSSRA